MDGPPSNGRSDIETMSERCFLRNFDGFDAEYIFALSESDLPIKKAVAKFRILRRLFDGAG